MGTALGIWLAWTTIGSIIGGKLALKLKEGTLAWNLILIAVALPATIFAIRSASSFFISGELPNIYTALGLTFLMGAPLCFSIGAMFPICIKFGPRNKRISQNLTSQAYLFETIGFTVGGLIFNFLLIKFPEFSTILLLSILNLAQVIFILPTKKEILKILIAFICFFLFINIIFGLGTTLNYETQKFRFSNLIESKNSIYGNIVVNESHGQYNFFESGLLIGPDRDTQTSESFSHLTMLQHEAPRKVLLIGGGWNGILKEVLKYQSIEQIDYVELDPDLVDIVKKYLDQDLVQVIDNKKVNIYNIDGREFLKGGSTKYDVIISNLPNPQTALINRFYTKEFFQESKYHLNDKGIFKQGGRDFGNIDLQNITNHLLKYPNSS